MSQRIVSVLEKLCDEFYGIEKKDQGDFAASIEAIILLVRNNLHDVIAGLNGEQNNTQTIAGLIPMNYDLHEAGVNKNSLFGTNLRILIAAFFRNEKLAGLMMDIRECSQIKSGEMPFSHMIKRFQHELDRFASNNIYPFEGDDMHQEGCIVLWNCVNKYSGQNFIPLRQYFLRSLKNKRVDMLRSIHSDKRIISIKTRSLNAGSRTESTIHAEMAKRYMDGYHGWLNSEHTNGDTSFVAPDSVADYFPETGKSITETQINKTVQKLFDSTIEELFLYVKTQIPEDHFKKLKEFFPTKKIGMVFLRFLFGNPEEGIGLDILQQRFLQTYMKEGIFFNGETYCFRDIGDLQETFLKMCKEIIAEDPMIQLAFRIGGRKYNNEVPF